MTNYGFNDSTSCKAAAERADLQEALLRGELTREEFTYLLTLIKSRNDEE